MSQLEQDLIVSKQKATCPFELSNKQLDMLIIKKMESQYFADKYFEHGFHMTASDKMHLRAMDLFDDEMQFFSQEQWSEKEQHAQKIRKLNGFDYHFKNKNKDKVYELWRMKLAIEHEEIFPTMRKLRLQLDDVISSTDCALITEIIIEKKKLSTAFHNLKQEKMDELGMIFHPINHKSPREAFEPFIASFQKYFNEVKGLSELEEFMDLYQEEKEINNQIEILTQKYKREITSLMDGIVSQRKEWDRRINGAFDNAFDFSSMDKSQKDHIAKRNHLVFIDNYDEHKYHKRFILFSFSHLSDAAKAKVNSEEDLFQTVTFPNPAVREQTLEFTIKQDGHVSVEIIDQKGVVIKTILNETRVAGQHQIQVDVSDLQDAIFYYRITDITGTSSTKFLKKGE